MLIVAMKIAGALLALWLWVGDRVQAEPITLAYNTNSLNLTLPMLVARELGFFTAVGFDIPNLAKSI